MGQTWREGRLYRHLWLLCVSRLVLSQRIKTLWGLSVKCSKAVSFSGVFHDLFPNEAHHNILDITELGRTSRLYCELAQRTEPTVSDVQLALIDAGK